jgi:hypothetical protein
LTHHGVAGILAHHSRGSAIGAIMTFKETVILAIKLAHRQQQELVVGREDGRWEIVPITDARSDQLRPSVIVTGAGLKYPEHEDLYARLVSEGA